MKNIKDLLSKVKYFLLDMDGTLFLGDHLIGEMDKTLNYLRSKGKNIIFLTNNSSKSKQVYQEKLSKLKLFCQGDVIYTSGTATSDYIIQNHKGKRVYLVGTPALEKEFIENGINLTYDMPDIAVLSYDTTLTYEKLCKFTNYVTKGALYIATHPDINCPAPDVYLPDIGSFMALIEKSTGKMPQIICGKPYKFMGETIKKRFSAKSSEIVMVGDRLSTDINFAINSKFKSLLVLSGETDADFYEKSIIRADAVLSSLNEIIKYM